MTCDLFQQSERDSAIDALHAATAIYTSEPVVDKLLARVDWPRARRRLVDSSCGDGAFIVRAIARLLDAHPAVSVHEICEQIEAWEIHAFAASQARARVRELLIDHGIPPAVATEASVRIVKCGDFLTDAKGPYAVVVGNPPYLRMSFVPEPLKAEYEQVVPGYARGDLLHAFLDRCTGMLEPGGELACVTSDRWFLNAGASHLREVIGRRFRLAHVERLDVTTSFYRPKQRRQGTPPRIHPCAVVLKAGEGTAITREPIYPGATMIVTKPALRLGAVANVRIAPWLGTPGIFLLDRAAATALPAEHLVPAIDTDDILNGVLRPARRYAILTHPDRAPHPHVLAHLEESMPKMCARGRRRSPHWMPPESFHRFDLAQPSLLIPRIAKTLKPVRVPAGVLPVNHNISIVRAREMTLEDLAAVLACERADEWVRQVAAPLENGYRSLTTRLLREMPVFGA
jgi:hypothetical protein